MEAVIELILNGFFETGALEPWTSCGGFLEGGVTDENWVYISDYNLKLRGDDCVEQQITPLGVAAGNLKLWVKWRPFPIEFATEERCGSFEAGIWYTGGTRDAVPLDWATLRGDDPAGMTDPRSLQVVNDPLRTAERARLRTYGAEESWFVCGVQLEGSMAKVERPPRLRPEHDRLVALERRVARLERFLIVV